MFRTCLPAGRYKENRKILLILSKNILPQAAKFKQSLRGYKKLRSILVIGFL